MKAPRKIQILLLAGAFVSVTTFCTVAKLGALESHEAEGTVFVEGEAGSAGATSVGSIPEPLRVKLARETLAKLSKDFGIPKDNLQNNLVVPFLKRTDIEPQAYLQTNSGFFDSVAADKRVQAQQTAEEALTLLKGVPVEPANLFNETFSKLASSTPDISSSGQQLTPEQQKVLEDAQQAKEQLEALQEQQRLREQQLAQQEEERRRQQAAGGGGSGGGGGGGSGGGGAGGQGGLPQGQSPDGGEAGRPPTDRSKHSDGLAGLTKALKNASKGNGLKDTVALSRAQNELSPKKEDKKPDFSALNAKKAEEEPKKPVAKPEIPGDLFGGAPVPTAGNTQKAPIDLGQGEAAELIQRPDSGAEGATAQAQSGQGSGIGSAPITGGGNQNAQAANSGDSFPFNVDGSPGPDDNPPPVSAKGLTKVALELLDLNATSITDAMQDFGGGMTDAMVAAKQSLQRTLKDIKEGTPLYLSKPNDSQLADKEAPGVLGIAKNRGTTRTLGLCQSDAGAQVGVCYRFRKVPLIQAAGLQPG